MTREAQAGETAAPSARARGEAAVWIARLHAPDRTSQVEAGLRYWLEESTEHRRAFELANEIWEAAGQLTDTVVPRIMRWRRDLPLERVSRRLLVIATFALFGVALGIYGFLNRSIVRTSVGEQRVMTLEDGTRVVLNTATRISVQYDRSARRVRLESGEALFEVARRPEWPFVVTVGERQVTALGTSFVVRRDEELAAVTLVEGKVVITAVTPINTPVPSVTLRPGERLTFSGTKSTRTDRPNLDKLTAWRRGLVVLDSARLADAASEMNRYSALSLVIAPEAADARVGGVFRVGDSRAFAEAIARVHQLKISEQHGQIVISGQPDASP